PRIALADTTMGKVAGSALIGGPKRGTTEFTVTSDYVTSRVPLQVVQFVAAIIPERDALSFSSLGAERSIGYEVRDDRGRQVSDTVAALSIVDTTVAQLTGEMVRSSLPGKTELRLSVGSVRSTV